MPEKKRINLPAQKFYDGGKLPFIGKEQGNDLESSFKWDHEVSNGSISTYQLRPGLILNLAELCVHQTMSIDYEVYSECINFSCCLAGQGICRPDSAKNDTRKEYIYGPASSSINLIPAHQGSGQVCSGQKTIVTELYLTRELFNEFLYEQKETLSFSAKQLVNEALDSFIAMPLPFTPEIQYLNRQILQCRLTGPLRRIYLEGKSLEMIALYLSALKMPEKGMGKGNAKGQLPMRPNEEERVRYAEKLIKKNMQEPLSLTELAQAVGLSHSKLNRFFPQVYGASVFEYLRNLRLHHAQKLLEDGNMNVTEVAFAVGYSNLSHFSKIFKEKTGLLPNKYLREMLQNSLLPRTKNF